MSDTRAPAGPDDVEPLFRPYNRGRPVASQPHRHGPDDP